MAAFPRGGQAVLPALERRAIVRQAEKDAIDEV